MELEGASLLNSSGNHVQPRNDEEKGSGVIPSHITPVPLQEPENTTIDRCLTHISTDCTAGRLCIVMNTIIIIVGGFMLGFGRNEVTKDLGIAAIGVGALGFCCGDRYC